MNTVHLLAQCQARRHAHSLSSTFGCAVLLSCRCCAQTEPGWGGWDNERVTPGCASVCESQQDTKASKGTNHFVNEISRKLIIHPLQCHCFRQSLPVGVHKLFLSSSNKQQKIPIVSPPRRDSQFLALVFGSVLTMIDRQQHHYSSSLFCFVPHDKFRRKPLKDVQQLLICLSLTETQYLGHHQWDFIFTFIYFSAIFKNAQIDQSASSHFVPVLNGSSLFLPCCIRNMR